MGLGSNSSTHSNKKRTSSLKLVIALGFFIFAAEFFIMVFLKGTFTFPANVENLVDASILLIVMSPALFLLYQELEHKKRIEINLKRERDKFKAIFEGSGDGIRIIDTNFNVMSANNVMAHLAGISVEEQIGKKCYESFPSSDCGTPNCTLKRILKGEPIVIEERLRSTPRGKVWMQHSASPLKNGEGQIIGIIEIFRDIHSRKQMEEALREAERRYRTVVENSPSGIFVLQDGILKFVNPRFAFIFGYPHPKDLINVELKKLFDKQEYHRLNQLIEKVMKNGRIIQRLELQGVKANGERVILGLTISKIDYQDRPAILGQGADITKRKETEKKLKEALDGLKKMQAQLVQQEKMASIGQLAAGIAHEMNNPAGFIASNFRNLREYMEDFKALLKEYQNLLIKLERGQEITRTEIEKVRQFEKEVDLEFMLNDIKELFEETEEGINRLTEIIQNLRNFSRVDQMGDYTEYNINEGIKSTLVIARNEYKYHAEVKTKLGNIPPVYCHPGQINQVLMNIIVNAAQAIKSQKRKDKGTIFIKTYSDDEYVYCQISDDGPGIPKEIQDKIFDPFFTTKEPGKGTGLGLSICYDIIVNKHKGAIWVESEPGKGTTFFIKLPLKKTPTEGNRPILGHLDTILF